LKQLFKLTQKMTNF